MVRIWCMLVTFPLICVSGFSSHGSLGSSCNYTGNESYTLWLLTNLDEKPDGNSSFWQKHCSAQCIERAGRKQADVHCQDVPEIPTADQLRELTGPYEITNLTVRAPTMTVLQNETFITHYNLESLTIIYQSLSKIEIDAFVGLKNLLNLHFSAVLPSARMSPMTGSFHPLESLKSFTVDKGDMDIKDVGSTLCDASKQLEYVYIEGAFGQGFSHDGVILDEDFSQCLSGITELYLPNNFIVVVTAGFVLNLEQVRVVSLRDNNIMGQREAAIFIPLLRNLVTLDLGCQYSRDCHPTYPPPEIRDTLDWQRFTQNDTFNVTDIGDRNNTKGIVIDPGLDHLKYIMFDQITAHAYTVDSREYSIILKGLQFLDISNTRLNDMKGTLCCTYDLRYLSLRHVRASAFDPSFLEGLPNLRVLLMADSVPLGTFENVSAEFIFSQNPQLLYLELSDNNIHSLPRTIFSHQTNLETLLLNKNKLTNLTIDLSGLLSIRLIDLSENHVQVIGDTFLQTLGKIQNGRLGEKIAVDFRNNPILCSCDVLSSLDQITTSSLNILGLNTPGLIDSLTCLGDRGQQVNLQQETERLMTTCQRFTTLDHFFLTLYPITLLMIVISCLFFRYRWKVHYYWLLTKYFLAREQLAENDNSDFIFDVFVSYSQEDEEFVDDNIVKPLEDKEQSPYKFCLHYRHFRPGYPISSNIVDGIRKSRTTLICVSKNFIKSGWCEFEAQFAHSHAITSRRSRVVAVVHPQVQRMVKANSRSVPYGLHVLLQSLTYLEWPVGRNARDLFPLRLKTVLGAPLKLNHKQDGYQDLLLLL